MKKSQVNENKGFTKPVKKQWDTKTCTRMRQKLITLAQPLKPGMNSKRSTQQLKLPPAPPTLLLLWPPLAHAYEMLPTYTALSARLSLLPVPAPMSSDPCQQQQEVNRILSPTDKYFAFYTFSHHYKNGITMLTAWNQIANAAGVHYL